jgi:serine/threonine-protein kinase RsbW
MFRLIRKGLNMGMLQHDHLMVNSDLTALTQVQGWFNQFGQSYFPQPFLSDKQLYNLNLALTEGFTNAVRHAHHALPPETKVEIAATVWDDRIEIRIWDQGPPFNPDTLKEPELGTLRQGGYGWFLLRRLADQVVYQRYQNQRNCLIIVKKVRQRQFS